MKKTIQRKSTIFLMTALLGAGCLTGCDSDKLEEPTTPPAAVQPEPEEPTTPPVAVEPEPEEPTTPPVVVTPPPAQAKVIQKGWYVRLIVQSDTLKDSSTVFGYLQGASDSKGRYDSEALSKTSGSYLYTTIYHEDFGSIKNYRSDYRAYRDAGEKSDTWTIKVNSGDANADITLSWNGITYVSRTSQSGFKEEIKTDGSELNQMRLIDVETGDVVPVLDNGMKISFNMNGKKEKTFQWVLLKKGEPEPDVLPVTKLAAPSVRSMSMQINSVETQNDDFAPPSFEKR